MTSVFGNLVVEVSVVCHEEGPLGWVMQENLLIETKANDGGKTAFK